MPNFHCKKWSTFLYLNELQVKKKKNFLSFIFLKLKSGLIKLLLAILLLLFSDSRILIQKWRSPKKKKKKKSRNLQFLFNQFPFLHNIFPTANLSRYQRISKNILSSSNKKWTHHHRNKRGGEKKSFYF